MAEISVFHLATRFVFIFISLYPCVWLCYCPFMDRLKRSVKKIAVESSLVCVVICVLDVYLYVYRGLYYSVDFPALVFLLFSIIYYIKTVQEGLNKLLFVFFTVVHLAALVGTIRIVLWYFFFYDYVSTVYDSGAYIALCNLFESLCNLIFYPAAWVVMFYRVTPRLKQIDSRHMRGLWLIPMAFFVLITIMSPYYDTITINQVIILLLGVSSFFVLILILRIIESISKSSRLESEKQAMNRQLELQGAHYKMLQTHIDETKRSEHNLRHHFKVIQSYATASENNKLESYLHEYIESMPDNKDITFCDNFAVNSVLQYYLNIAKKESIEVDVLLEIPAIVSIPDSDLCIIFGNTVENAIEACRRVDGERYVKIRSSLMENMFTIIIANSFDGTVNKDNGKFMSLKHEGEGIGISSVKAVVEKYSESAQFETDGNEFRATIILCV